MKEASSHDLRFMPGRRPQGFSLVQLMITVAIVGILTGIAIPSFKYITNATRIANEINGLLGDLQYARFAAVKAGRTVTVCSSTNPAAAAPTCSTSTNWATGWIVFTDITGTGQFAAGEGVLRRQLALGGSDTLVGDKSGITFNRDGFPVTSVTAPNTLDITWKLHATPTNNQWTRCIKAGINGQVLSEQYGVGVCT